MESDEFTTLPESLSDSLTTTGAVVVPTNELSGEVQRVTDSNETIPKKGSQFKRGWTDFRKDRQVYLEIKNAPKVGVLGILEENIKIEEPKPKSFDGDGTYNLYITLIQEIRFLGHGEDAVQVDINTSHLPPQGTIEYDMFGGSRFGADQPDHIKEGCIGVALLQSNTSNFEAVDAFAKHSPRTFESTASSTSGIPNTRQPDVRQKTSTSSQPIAANGAKALILNRFSSAYWREWNTENNLLIDTSIQEMESVEKKKRGFRDYFYNADGTPIEMGFDEKKKLISKLKRERNEELERKGQSRRIQTKPLVPMRSHEMSKAKDVNSVEYLASIVREHNVEIEKKRAQELAIEYEKARENMKLLELAEKEVMEEKKKLLQLKEERRALKKERERQEYINNLREKTRKMELHINSNRTENIAPVVPATGKIETETNRLSLQNQLEYVENDFLVENEVTTVKNDEKEVEGGDGTKVVNSIVNGKEKINVAKNNVRNGRKRQEKNGDYQFVEFAMPILESSDDLARNHFPSEPTLPDTKGDSQLQPTTLSDDPLSKFVGETKKEKNVGKDIILKEKGMEEGNKKGTEVAPDKEKVSSRAERNIAVFGWNCSRQEHILYGRCLDLKCGTRAVWEKTALLCGQVSRINGASPKKDPLLSKALELVDGPPRFVSALHAAVFNSDVDTIRKLVHVGDNVNKVITSTPKGHTVLHIATSRRLADAVEALIDTFEGVIDMDPVDTDGDTPLHIASREGDLTIVNLLCDGGAGNVLIKNKKGKLPSDLAKSHNIFQVIELSRMASLLKKELKDVSNRKTNKEDDQQALLQQQVESPLSSPFISNVSSVKTHDMKIDSKDGDADESSRTTSRLLSVDKTSKFIRNERNAFRKKAEMDGTSFSVRVGVRNKTDALWSIDSKVPNLHTYTLGFLPPLSTKDQLACEKKTH